MTTSHPPNRPWTSTAVPESVTQLPRMLSADELRYLVWLTANRYEGWGHIVDLGCWLGSSSACFAEGLRRSGRPGVVQSLDLFVWDAGYMNRDAGFELPDGSDFLPRFVDLVAPWRDRIVPTRANLLQHRWDGGPVEILFVDAAKSWQLTNAILRTFADAIVPCRTRVVFQDFRLPRALWLPLFVGRREDQWRELENTADGTTVTFEAVRPLHGDEAPLDVDSFGFDEARRILRARMQRDPDGLHQYRQAMLRAARLWGSEADVASARRELVEAEGASHDPAAHAALEDVSADILLASWAANERGDHGRAIELARRCRERVPSATLALGPLGFAHMARGELTEAAAALELLLERDPGREAHQVYVADLRTRQGRHREALRILEVVVPQLSPEATRADHVLTILKRIAEAPDRRDAAVRVAMLASPEVRALPEWATALAGQTSG